MKRTTHALLLSTFLNFSLGATSGFAMDTGAFLANETLAQDMGRSILKNPKEDFFERITVHPRSGRPIAVIRGTVPGDGDCGPHSASVLFPELGINRRSFFEVLMRAFDGGDNDLKALIGRELFLECNQQIMGSLWMRAVRGNELAPQLRPLAERIETDIDRIIRNFIKPTWERDGLTQEEDVLRQLIRYPTMEVSARLEYELLERKHRAIYDTMPGKDFENEKRNGHIPVPYNKVGLDTLSEQVWTYLNDVHLRGGIGEYLGNFEDEFARNQDLLQSVLPYFASNDTLLTSPPPEGEAVGGGLGSFGLLCRLFGLNVRVFYRDAGERFVERNFYNYGKDTPVKDVLWRNGHFSPLATLDDLGVRNEMAYKLVAQMLLGQHAFKTYNPIEDPMDRFSRELLEGAERHMQWPVLRDYATLEWENYTHPKAGLGSATAMAPVASRPDPRWMPLPSSAYGDAGGPAFGAPRGFASQPTGFGQVGYGAGLPVLDPVEQVLQRMRSPQDLGPGDFVGLSQDQCRDLLIRAAIQGDVSPNGLERIIRSSVTSFLQPEDLPLFRAAFPEALETLRGMLTERPEKGTFAGDPLESQLTTTTAAVISRLGFTVNDYNSKTNGEITAMLTDRLSAFPLEVRSGELQKELQSLHRSGVLSENMDFLGDFLTQLFLEEEEERRPRPDTLVESKSLAELAAEYGQPELAYVEDLIMVWTCL